MLMALWDRHRRVLLILLALLFVSLSFYFYYTVNKQQDLPLHSPIYSTEQDLPSSVTGPETLVASSGQSGSTSALTAEAARQGAAVEQTAVSSLLPIEQPRGTAKERTMYVDVKGQVKQPGIYPFTDNERIADAIDKAGGFLPAADTLQVNLAQHLADGMYIIVPAKGGQPASASPLPVIATTGGGIAAAGASAGAAGNVVATGGAAGGLVGAGTGAGTGPNSSANHGSTVSLNTATVDQLATLPGIGKTRAETILAYREQHGRFTKIEQLKNISGIGDKLFEKLKGKISVD